MLGIYSLPALAVTTADSVAFPDAVALPEPGALSLLAIGAVGGLIIWARNRKK